MMTFLTALHIAVCVFLILVVLLQAGKGGGMGIAFGGGGSQTVFGSSGAGNFLTRLTSITAMIFLVTSLGLAHYSSQQDSRRLQRLAEQKDVEAEGGAREGPGRRGCQGGGWRRRGRDPGGRRHRAGGARRPGHQARG